MTLTQEQRQKIARKVTKAAELAVERRPGERGVSYYARCLVWTVTTAEGKAALEAAHREIVGT